MEATTIDTTQAQPIDLLTDTLTGDIRDVLLGHVRAMQDPWSKLSESRQAEKIHAIEKCAQDLVRRAVQLVAHQGFPHVGVTLGKWAIGDAIEMKITASRSLDNINRFGEHGMGSAVLVLVEPGVFFGQRQAAQADPDQPAMDLEGTTAVGGTPESYEAMIERAESLSGLCFCITDWPEERREEVAAKIRAKGGSIMEAAAEQGDDASEEGEGEDEAEPTEEEQPPSAETGRSSRRGRRRISESEAA